MPVPGPRTQFRPLPGYTNPDQETPDRINHWERPAPVAMVGRSPGTMERDLRGNMLAAGQVRRYWRQTADYIAATAGYSWTRSAPAPGRPVSGPGAFFITTALRYMARSTYAAAGDDNTRITGLHTKITSRVRSAPVTTGAGGVRNRPTVRNRLTSFGSRVPTLNNPSGAAQK